VNDVIVNIFIGAALLTIASCIYISVVIGKEDRDRGRGK